MSKFFETNNDVLFCIIVILYSVSNVVSFFVFDVEGAYISNIVWIVLISILNVVKVWSSTLQQWCNKKR